MPNSHIKAIARALQEGDRKQQLEGLSRLITSFGYDKALAEFAEENGIIVDYSNFLIELVAWSLVGPELAKNNKIYLGRRNGRPKGSAKRYDIKRASLVKRVAGSFFEKHGTKVPDSKIIELAQKEGYALFSAISPEAAANSVSQGKKLLELEQKLVAEALSQKMPDSF